MSAAITSTSSEIKIDMDLFERAHKEQLESLQIPPVLWRSLAEQLQASFPLQIQAANANANANATGQNEEEAVVLLDPQGSIDACQNQCKALLSQKKHEEIPQKMGTMLVLPHICSWDMLDGRGMYEALSNLPENVLASVYQGLLQATATTTTTSSSSSSENSKAEIPSSDKDKNALVNRICEIPETWSYVILYRGQQGQVRAALPSPPYLPHVEYSTQTDLDRKEADLVGPFPFQYYHALTKGDQDHPPQMLLIECSLAYLSGDNLTKLNPPKSLPTMDVVPAPTVPNALTRMVRYAALLGPKHAPEFCVSQSKEIHATFVRQMHLVRQQTLEADLPETSTKTTNNSMPSKEIWKVYTDAPNNNDPLELSHPDCGLTSSKFQVVSDPHEADILYSYQSVFAPNSPLNSILKKEKSSSSSSTDTLPLINQFPYEGAFVQKDHLGREILKQHGLPRPSWAMETYDLDVQLGEFVGAAILAMENAALTTTETNNNNNKPPLWIIKPAKGTQSRGHVVTRNLAQIMRLVDAGGYSKVAQRYIERPLCYQGRKVDCRCIVMMTSATAGHPTLYMHNRVYFRIAAKAHSVTTAEDLVDKEKVLTAMHLVDEQEEESHKMKDENDSKTTTTTTTPNRMVLPVDYKTIAQLEEDYKEVGFDWNENILPKIQSLIKELFNGMTLAYPAMGESSNSRAVYGIDVMFEIDEANKSVEVKLTEVTFCPSNNAVCDAYERDEELYKNYNNEIFSCLFLGEVSENITQLQ